MIRFLTIFLIIFVIPLTPYQSGDLIGNEISSDLLDIIELDLLMNRTNWSETHCKITAQKIISLLSQKGLLKLEGEFECFDFNNFAFYDIGKKLFIQTNEEQHCLFHINLCGSAHVLIIEKKINKDDCWLRIFHSWQNQFTLAQWLGIDE